MRTAAFVPEKRGPRQNDVHEIRLFQARPQLHATLTQYTAWIAPQSLAVQLKCDTINAQRSERRGDDASSMLLPSIVASDEDITRLHRARRSSCRTMQLQECRPCTRLESCRHGRVLSSCAHHHAGSCEPVVVPCTTRVLHDSNEHEDGSIVSECRSCGSCIEASRRRCRGCMSVGEADCRRIAR